MLYYNARYYDPNIGRFFSADTIVPSAGALTVAPSDTTAAALWGMGGAGAANPQELNRYSYVNNNPLRYTDPTGHCSAERATWDPKCHGMTYTRIPFRIEDGDPLDPANGGNGNLNTNGGRSSGGGGGTSGGRSWGNSSNEPLSSPDKPFLVTEEGVVLPPNRDIIWLTVKKRIQQIGCRYTALRVTVSLVHHIHI